MTVSIFSRMCLLIALAGLSVSSVVARSDAPPPENRFLIVIDTAASMRRCSNSVAQAVTELFQSNMKGEFRPGDTIGLWTYSDTLQTAFPMQIWNGSNGARIQHDALTFLREHRYEKRAHLDKTLPIVGQVIGESPRITVIFIFDGLQPIKGTPFDGDIEALQEEFGTKFRKDHLPFVTVLAARNGTIFDYTINTPGSISLPHTALPYPPPVTNSPPEVAAAPLTNVIVTPPPPHKHLEIVVSGAAIATMRSNAIAASEPPAALALTNGAAAIAPPPNPGTNVVAAELTNTGTNPPVVSAAMAGPPAPTPLATPSAGSAIAPQQPRAPISERAVTPPIPMPPTLTRGLGIDEIALFIVAFSLLVMALVLMCFVLWRGRMARSPSLISQSMDRSP